MPISMPDSTLSAIEVKVRRMTRSPSPAQLTIADLENYINTFVIYDFPEHLRTFNLRTTFTFYTNPYQDEYFTDEASFGDAFTNPDIVYNPLYNFQNKYLTVHPPVYIAGYERFYTQSRDEFYRIYPKLNFVQFTGQAGDGITTSFSGVINTQQSMVPSNFQQHIALLQRQVLFDSVDVNLNGLALVDVPVINPDTGNPTVNGNLYNPASAAYQAALVKPPTMINAANTINYATGVYKITFDVAPGPDARINSQTVPVVVTLPLAMLYYANRFVLRPVPDQTYRVNIEVYKRPSALLATNQSPELEEYWQLIAVGAAIKILQDRMDMDSVNLLMPEFRNQMNLCNRRSIVQYTNERTSTIYTDSLGYRGWWGGWGNGNNF